MDLDHNSGGRIRPEVALFLDDLLHADLANPSSVHAAGRRARALVEEARDAVAALCGARPAEVVFTSGGTEANNLAVLSAAHAGAHLVSTPIEHVSVLRALDAASREGARVTLVAPGADGSIRAAEVERALCAETALVSVGWANGELGTVQPIDEVVAAARRARGDALHVHSDAVQAAGVLAIDFARSGLDSLSLSGHKLGALAGVGALVVRAGTSLRPTMRGGAQERERRAGTENVLGIASFGVAARLALAERAWVGMRAGEIRCRLWRALAANAAPVLRFGPDDDRGLPTTLSVAFPGVRGDALVLALDQEGIAASTGSACAAGGAEPSHVLRALGCSEEVARSALRLSFGAAASDDEVERAAATIAALVARARAASGSARAGAIAGASRAA